MERNDRLKEIGIETTLVLIPAGMAAAVYSVSSGHGVIYAIGWLFGYSLLIGIIKDSLTVFIAGVVASFTSGIYLAGVLESLLGLLLGLFLFAMSFLVLLTIQMIIEFQEGRTKKARY